MESGRNVKRVDKETQEHLDKPRDALPASLAQTAPTNFRDPYQALHFRDFRLLFLGTFIASIGEQMVNVAIGWELYERTGSALVLGLIGLAQAYHENSIVRLSSMLYEAFVGCD